METLEVETKDHVRTLPKDAGLVVEFNCRHCGKENKFLLENKQDAV